MYRAGVFLNLKPDAVTDVHVEGRIFTLPYVVQGYCADFDSYWDLWCSQYGLSVSFRELDIVDGQHLELILLECFKKYEHILDPGSCPWLDSFF